MQQRFAGFEEEAFGFFLMIRMNNNKAFFEDNRETYERCLKRPLWALAQDLEDDLWAIDPKIETRPSKCVARIRRSTLFSNNKLPYRDYLWIGWRDRTDDQRHSHAFGFFFHLSFDELCMGAGAYNMPPAQVKLLRERIAANPERFERIAKGVSDAGFYVHGPNYVRLIPPENLGPYAMEFYMKKHFSVERDYPMDDTHLGPELVGILRRDINALKDLYAFMTEQALQ